LEKTLWVPHIIPEKSPGTRKIFNDLVRGRITYFEMMLGGTNE
jgi:hypothetical protein